MKLSTEIGSTAALIGELRAVELVAAAGFEAYDLSMFAMAPYDHTTRTLAPTDHPMNGSGYAAYVKQIAHIAKECGITCTQSHAPFPVYCPGMLDYVKRALECTAIAGADLCVVHPDNYKNAEQNAELFSQLLPIAKSYGVRIATENMWCWDNERGHARAAACSHHEDFCRHIDRLSDPYLVACLDIGHAEMRGLDTCARDMILALGPRLQALHLHDNDRLHDSHALPFTMQIDFTAVTDALRHIGYTGDITLEADRHMTGACADDVPARLREMAAAARRLRDMVLGQ